MPKPRAAGLVATAILISLMHGRSGAALLSQHVGATDPTTEGFAQFNTITSTGPVSNDGGFDAWQVTGSAGGCCGFFGQEISYANAFTAGWRLTARMRVVSGSGAAYFGLNTLSDRPRFDAGVRTVGGDAVVGL
jgi:hypothetical protein